MMVISAKNPVHSVLFLILTFISVAGLLLLLEVEFISLIFIVVYVGAIAVLFLFVVMMLDIKISESKRNLFQYFPIGSALGIAFLIEIFIVLTKSFEPNFYYAFYESDIDWLASIDYITDVGALGQILYTSLFLYFLIGGLLLLIAIIGAIVLTLTVNKNSKIQIIYKQVARNFNKAILLTNTKMKKEQKAPDSTNEDYSYQYILTYKFHYSYS
jgi:NADH-quinone oxidoreductase subunit J